MMCLACNYVAGAQLSVGRGVTLEETKCDHCETKEYSNEIKLPINIWLVMANYNAMKDTKTFAIELIS
jgi:hypothetical protein